MPRDTLKWRAAVRAESPPLVAGPWRAGGWYPSRPVQLISWRHFRRFATLKLEISETYKRVTTAYSTPTSTLGDPKDLQIYTTEKSYHFLATVAAADVWRGHPGTLPTNTTGWFHNSATAYGQGLYDCTGQFDVFGSATTTNKLTDTFTPATGSPTTSTPINTTSTVDAYRQLPYLSDHTAINGLITPCRLQAYQTFPPPVVSDFDAGVYFTPGTDPDGNPGIEEYWTDTALSVIAAGVWSTSIVLANQTLTGSLDPNGYGLSNGDNWSDHYERTGTLKLELI